MGNANRKSNIRLLFGRGWAGLAGALYRAAALGVHQVDRVESPKTWQEGSSLRMTGRTPTRGHSSLVHVAQLGPQHVTHLGENQLTGHGLVDCPTCLFTRIFSLSLGDKSE